MGRIVLFLWKKNICFIFIGLPVIYRLLFTGTYQFRNPILQAFTYQGVVQNYCFTVTITPYYTDRCVSITVVLFSVCHFAERFPGCACTFAFRRLRLSVSWRRFSGFVCTLGCFDIAKMRIWEPFCVNYYLN